MCTTLSFVNTHQCRSRMLYFPTCRQYAILVDYLMIRVEYSDTYWYGITFTSFTFVLFVIFLII
jgi:hypothetical protein